MTLTAPLAVLWIVAAPQGAQPPPPAVETFGTIRRLTDDRDAGPKVTLSQVQASANAYGLGSLSELRGEITLLDGVAWLAYPPAAGSGQIPRVVSAAESSEKAGFLAVSHVPPPAWHAVGLPDALTSETLQATIERLLPPARKKKGRGRAFPFRVEGHFQHVTLAIVDGRLLPPGARGEKAVEKANVLQALNEVDGTLVGFFSFTDGAAFNHAGRRVHVHAILPRNQASGHAQSFVMAPGATLLMP
jgi:alpha-acetolactate decarboxylase